MLIFPNCVKNVSVQGISDYVKFSRKLMQKILDLLSCDLTNSIKRSELHVRYKIVDERQENICDLRINRVMCTLVIIYMHIYPRVP